MARNSRAKPIVPYKRYVADNVPVLDQDMKPLMPTYPRRARKLLDAKKATAIWIRGVFCIRLNKPPSDRQIQRIAVGVDPGTKMEGYTVKSGKRTLLNIQREAITWVSGRVEVRRNCRQSRRNRRCPYRGYRHNMSTKPSGWMPPSIKARWQVKLNTIKLFARMYPISDIVVEDVSTLMKTGKRRWNKSFSAVMWGKNWFYRQAKKIAHLTLVDGYKTALLREPTGIIKSSDKLSTDFNAHCIDSWVLANDAVGGHIKPDLTRVIYLKQIRFYRRQLRVTRPKKGDKVFSYGGTLTLGFKRGALARHKKHGLVLIGGLDEGLVRIHRRHTGAKIGRAKPSDLTHITYNHGLMGLV